MEKINRFKKDDCTRHIGPQSPQTPPGSQNRPAIPRRAAFYRAGKAPRRTCRSENAHATAPGRDDAR